MKDGRMERAAGVDALPAALTNTKGIHLGRSGRQKITEWTLLRRPYYRCAARCCASLPLSQRQLPQ